MSRSLKSLILVVLMFAQAVSDLQNNSNISDFNSTSPILKDPQRNLSGEKTKSQPELPDAQLSPYNNSTLSDIHVNSSEYYYHSLEDSSDSEHWIKIPDLSKEAELLLTGRLSTIFIPSFYTLVFIISVPLNICALLVFVLRIKPRKPASIYMMNLACADLLCAAVLPLKIFYHFNGNDWIFGSTMCHLVTAAFFWNMYCSVLLIASISVDRFLAVVYPVESLTWRSSRKSVIVCVVMWVLSFAGTIPLLITEQTVRLDNITTCYDLFPMDMFQFYMIYYITYCCLFFFLPLVITAFSYTRVILTLSKAQPSPAHKKRRAVVLASTVLVMFVICFTPTNCLCIVRLIDSSHAENYYRVYLTFQCLGSVNCLLDPLVYFFGSSQFHKELSSMLRCQKIRKGTSRGQSSSDPSASTRKTTLRTNCKENSKTNSSLTNRDSTQSNLA